MQKRGQVSFFIIIGIVILIIFSTYLILRQSTEQDLVVAPEYEPISQFVQGCMQDTLAEALILIGENGGHIYVPEGLNNPLLFYEKTPLDTLRVPFWWYEGKTMIPTLEYEESQILRFVNENLPSCLNFETFENSFIIEPRGEEPQIELQLNDETTILSMQYPLTITRKANEEVNTDLEEFQVILPIRFKKMFELATTIMEEQLTQKFIEEKTIDLIALSREDQIPYTGTEVKCGRRTWEIDEIKAILQNRMQSNFDFIKIEGTSYNPDALVDVVRGTTFAESYYGNHYVWDIGEEEYPDTHVSFQFSNTSKFFINVRPSKGGQLMSNADQGTQLLSFFCWNIWHFTYDLTFPVKVILYDDQTATHDSYRFVFAFQGAIEQNKPSREVVTSRNFETEIYDDVVGYCETDENDALITLTVRDQASLESIENAELQYICGNVQCDLGKTLQQEGGSFAWNDRLPFCTSAIIEAKAEGYQEGRALIQTDEPGEYTVDLVPMRTLTNLKVVKHVLLNQRDEQDQLIPPGTAQELASDEQAFILIEPLDDSYDESYTVYPEGPEEFKLVIPAVPEQTYKVSVTLLKGALEEDPIIIGGYEGVWQPTDFEAQIAEEVVFHVLEFKGSNEEQTLFLAGLKSYSELIPAPEVIG